MKMDRVKTLGVKALATCFAFLLSGCFCLEGGVFIPDPALRAAVRLELMKPLGCISQTDVLGVTELQLSGAGVENLEGLQHFANLDTLVLSNNNISSIAPLSALGTNLPCPDGIEDGQCHKLRVLDISSNDIIDLQPLSGLLSLELLDVSFNNINLWSPIVSVVRQGFPTGGDLVVDETAVVNTGTDGGFLPGFQEVQEAGDLRDSTSDFRITILTTSPSS